MPDRRSLTSALNGRKSKGPVTPEGKARSARNAEKHGIYSHHIALGPEDIAALEKLRHEFRAHFQPKGRNQSRLVDIMAAAVWRRNRLMAIETATFEQILADPNHKSTGRLLADLCGFQSRESRAFHFALERFEQVRHRDALLIEATQNPQIEPNSYSAAETQPVAA
jgi:hypothetical protein